MLQNRGMDVDSSVVSNNCLLYIDRWLLKPQAAICQFKTKVVFILVLSCKTGPIVLHSANNLPVKKKTNNQNQMSAMLYHLHWVRWALEISSKLNHSMILWFLRGQSEPVPLHSQWWWAYLGCTSFHVVPARQCWQEFGRIGLAVVTAGLRLVSWTLVWFWGVPCRGKKKKECGTLCVCISPAFSFGWIPASKALWIPAGSQAEFSWPNSVCVIDISLWTSHSMLSLLIYQWGLVYNTLHLKWISKICHPNHAPAGSFPFYFKGVSYACPNLSKETWVSPHFCSQWVQPASLQHVIHI